MGPRAWAEALFDSLDDPANRDTWYVIYDATNIPVGYVGLGTFTPEGDKVATIQHIGVVTAHRGRGYVNQLLRLVDRGARQRGFTGIISDVDVRNLPMMAAMARHGHRADRRLWHKWIYRRTTR